MSGGGIEMGTLKGVPEIAENGDLKKYGLDEDWPNVYKSRAQPRVLKCGEGLFFRVELNPGVFFPAVFLIWGFILWSFADQISFNAEFSNLAYTVIVEEYSWLYILSINLFGVFCFYLCFSKMGGIVLAPPDKPEPDFPYYSWFSMLFSAGVGIGLFFFGVWEPLNFYLLPTRDNYQMILPRCEGSEVYNCCNDWANPAQCFEPKSRYARANSAMNIAWFDWGIAASACYVVFGLPLAFYHYRYGMPLSVRSGFYPIIGNRIYGWFGDLTDAFCIMGTIFGVCTSLGLGVTQMVTGMGIINPNITSTIDTYVVVILCITAVATMSVVTGLDVGIRRLSEVNFTLGICLLVIVFVLGKPEFFLDLYTQVFGYHIQHLPETSFYGSALERHVAIDAYNADTNPDGVLPPLVTDMGTYPNEYEANWTIFYWGWWFSWSPFVGTFLARISKGRTVREFIVGNMIVPTLLTSLWFTIFGGSGFAIQMHAENLKLDCLADAQGSETMFNVTGHDNKQWIWYTGKAAFLKNVTDGGWDWKADNKAGVCEAEFKKWIKANLGSVGPYDFCNLDNDDEPKFANLGCRIAPGQWGGRTLLFDVLKWWSLSEFTMPLAITGLFTYFITSSDSASQVCDMIASNGDLDPPYWQRMFWSVSEGLLAIILVNAGAKDDGTADTTSLWAVLAASISAGFPLVLIMLVLVYATYKALKTEQAIIDGEELEVQKQYTLPFPDAVVQLCGKCCCGLGLFWCTAGGRVGDAMMGCVNACCSCWCPHLMVLRGLLLTTESMVWKALTAIAVLTPWVLMFVFFGMCPQWVQVFETYHTENIRQPDGKFIPNPDGGYYNEADDCQDVGYYALGCAMYLIMVGFTMCFRNRVRDNSGIQGNACEDIVLTLFCPHVTVYQSYVQLESAGSGAAAPQAVPAKTGGADASGSV